MLSNIVIESLWSKIHTIHKIDAIRSREEFVTLDLQFIKTQMQIQTSDQVSHAYKFSDRHDVTYSKPGKIV